MARFAANCAESPAWYSCLYPREANHDAIAFFNHIEVSNGFPTLRRRRFCNLFRLYCSFLLILDFATFKSDSIRYMASEELRHAGTPSIRNLI